MIFKEWRLPTVYSKTVIFRLYIDKSMLHRVKFVNCKLTGTKLMESYIGNTLFENCKMDYVNLSGSNIKESTFEHSVLSSADFVDCSSLK